MEAKIVHEMDEAEVDAIVDGVHRAESEGRMRSVSNPRAKRLELSAELSAKLEEEAHVRGTSAQTLLDDAVRTLLKTT